MALALQRFDSSNIDLICDYIESIKEFDEITAIVPKNREVCEAKLRELLDTEQAYGVVVFDSEFDKIAGIGIVTQVEMWWTSEKTWNNILFYVEQGYRGTNASTLLMNFFKDVSDVTNIPLYFDVIASPETNFAVYDRVFRYRGLKRVGSSFIYNKAAA